MVLSREKFREIVFQLLYSQDFFTSEEEDIVGLMMAELSVTKKSMMEATRKRELVFSRLSEIDDLITKFSSSYEIGRIGKVEKSILRLAVYELCFEDALPPKVAISEAIRLTRKFSTAQSGAFINAVLDAVLQSRSKPGEKIDETATVLSAS